MGYITNGLVLLLIIVVAEGSETKLYRIIKCNKSEQLLRAFHAPLSANNFKHYCRRFEPDSCTQRCYWGGWWDGGDPEKPGQGDCDNFWSQYDVKTKVWHKNLGKKEGYQAVYVAGVAYGGSGATKFRRNFCCVSNAYEINKCLHNEKPTAGDNPTSVDMHVIAPTYYHPVANSFDDLSNKDPTLGQWDYVFHICETRLIQPRNPCLDDWAMYNSTTAAPVTEVKTFPPTPAPTTQPPPPPPPPMNDVPVPPPSPCAGADLKSEAGVSYKVIDATTNVTRVDAAKKCHDLGLILPSLRSPAEEVALVKALNLQRKVESNVWIGLYETHDNSAQKAVEIKNGNDMTKAMQNVGGSHWAWPDGHIAEIRDGKWALSDFVINRQNANCGFLATGTGAGIGKANCQRPYAGTVCECPRKA